jgi:predicted phage terminase large subunit-like protein
VTSPPWLQYALAAFAPAQKRWATPGDLAVAMNPATVRTPALDLIDAALVDVAEGRCERLIITMPPQEGKSTRVAQDFPAWYLTRNPEARIVVASYGTSLAVRNGRAIRRRIEGHRGLHGLTVAPDNGAVHDWTLAGHDGGVLSVGVGAGLTGRPADLEIIDDPIKDRKEADSETFRQTVWDWWTDVASTRLAPGAPVVVILTRWHEDDLAGRLLEAAKKGEGDQWRVLNIPAQADHRPELGETDPLGRQPGQFMDSARRRTVEQWLKIKARSVRTWNALYQGKPAPAEGLLFKRDDWQWYADPQWYVRDDGVHLVPLAAGDELCQSWDMAFKGTDASDYVCGGVWLRRGVQAWLLDLVLRRMDFTETLTAVKVTTAKWPQAVAKYVEDKANGTAVINMLSRSVGGLIPVEPDGGKVARAQAVAPFQKAHNVFLPDPELLPLVGELVDQAASFPAGRHDDAVDMLTQALNRLLLAPLLIEDTVFEDAATDDDFAYLRSAY